MDAAAALEAHNVTARCHLEISSRVCIFLHECTTLIILHIVDTVLYLLSLLSFLKNMYNHVSTDLPYQIQRMTSVYDSKCYP